MTDTGENSLDQHSGARHWLGYAAVASFVLAVINHQLAPQPYALTHLFISYEHGFIRRGLLGEVLRVLWPVGVAQPVVFATAFAMTFLGAISFVAVLLKFLPRSDARLWVVIIALNSYAFASYLGVSGYLDGVLLILTALALLASNGPFGILIKCALVAVGALVHEVMVPFFAVIISLDIWLSRTGPRRWIATLPLGVGIGLAAALFLIGEPSPEALTALIDSIGSRAPFTPHPDALAVLGQSLDANNAAYQNFRDTNALYYFMVMFDGTLGVLMAAWLLWLSSAVLGRTDALTKLALFGAIAAPFSMNLVAIDVVRFSTMAVLCGFLALALVCRHNVGSASNLAKALPWPVAVLVLVLNANLFTMAINQNAGHRAQAPWVLLHQLNWLRPLE